MNSQIALIFGASGSGKSTLLAELVKDPICAKLDIHQKGSTRKLRQYDGTEIISVTEAEISHYDYIYSRYGHKYGLEKKQINVSISAGRIHVAICNDISVIRKIKEDYHDLVRVIYLLFDAPKNVIEKIQQDRGISDDEIQLRTEKIDVLNDVFIKNSQLFDGVIINKYGSSPTLMVNQLMGVLRAPADYHDTKMTFAIEEMARGMALLKRHLIPMSSALDIIEKNYAFIIMAMDKANPRTREIHATIKRSLSSLGINAERIDDILHGKNINDMILSSIRVAEFLVADITFERPNCYYEIGYAHGLGKDVILVAQSETKIHFDLQNLQIEFYDDLEQLGNILVRRVVKTRNKLNS